MDETRRSFLARTAGGALVLGLPALLRGGVEERKSPYPHWCEARDVMGGYGAHGVAIVIPSSAAERARLGSQLETLLATHDAALRERLVEAIYVCVEPQLVEVKPGENVVLLSPDGDRVTGASIDFSDADEVRDELTRLLHGDGRLERRAEKATTAELEQALKDLVADDERYAESWQVLSAKFLTYAPALIDRAARTRDEKLRSRIRAMLRGRFEHQARVDAPKLPFGVEWKREAVKADPCPTCGMAFAPPQSRKFIRFARRG